MKITVVVGNPKSRSRTRTVAEQIVGEFCDVAQHDVVTIDLADYADQLFQWPSEELDLLNARVAQSELAVFASPTYKASYTGLLKAFLDRYPANGLSGVVAVPVMTGADLGHSMGADAHLGPLLLELGAVLPGKGLYFVTGDMDRLSEFASESARQLATNMAKVGFVGSQSTASIDS